MSQATELPESFIQALAEPRAERTPLQKTKGRLEAEGSPEAEALAGILAKRGAEAGRQAFEATLKMRKELKREGRVPRRAPKTDKEKLAFERLRLEQAAEIKREQEILDREAGIDKSKKHKSLRQHEIEGQKYEIPQAIGILRKAGRTADADRMERQRRELSSMEEQNRDKLMAVVYDLIDPMRQRPIEEINTDIRLYGNLGVEPPRPPASPGSGLSSMDRTVGALLRQQPKTP